MSLPVINIRTDDDRRQHPYCQECKIGCEKSGKDWSKVTSNCKGIYSEEDFEQLAKVSKLNVDEIRGLLDPSQWMYENLGFIPYWYQDRESRCTSIRQAIRQGRRTGKTELFAALLIYFAYTAADTKILCVSAMKSHVKEIRDRILKFIESNPALAQEVTKSIQQPYYEIVLANGSRIRVFVAGSSSGGSGSGTQVRGQEADIIFLDEMDYISEESMEAILPILSDPTRNGEPVKLFVSSTPLGIEGYFYKFCNDPFFKEFHYPSHCRPDWDDTRDREARTVVKTILGYQHEYLAEWGSRADGVFRRKDIVRAQMDYIYPDFKTAYDSAEWPTMKWWPTWTYIMGVDWNGPGNGTRIAIVGWNPINEKHVVVYREAVDVEEFSLRHAVDRIVKLNREWHCHAVYIDAGFGQMQDEILRSIGRAAKVARANGYEYEPADCNLEDKLATVDFGSTIEYKVKEEGKLVEKKKATKNYMVENFQRAFENEAFWFSRADEDLKQQLLGYTIARFGAKHNEPVYKASPEVGDHDLDAVMLGLYGFNREFDPMFAKPTYVYEMAHLPIPGMSRPSNVDPISNPVDFVRQGEEHAATQPAGAAPVKSRVIKKENKTPIHAGNFMVLYNNQNSGNAKPGRFSVARPQGRTNWARKQVRTSGKRIL